MQHLRVEDTNHKESNVKQGRIGDRDAERRISPQPADGQDTENPRAFKVTLLSGSCFATRDFPWNKHLRVFLIVAAVIVLFLTISCRDRRVAYPGMSRKPWGFATQAERLESDCLEAGWQKLVLRVNALERRILWKEPKGEWKNGAIVVLHGGGGSADHFCAGRSKLVQPQIRFAKMALAAGFAVFSLDSTNNAVTDSAGRTCGKRFDFSVLDRPNVDLPFIHEVITKVIPAQRPAGSSHAVFMTGLSTGGYMTIRAATRFSRDITAFAPISSGDPYGTDAICDPALSPRRSAIGILVDRETRQPIQTANACLSNGYANEARWDSGGGPLPHFKQFHDADDGIVDLSCMRKVTTLLRRQGYPESEAFLIPSAGQKDAYKHLWHDKYNQPLIDFFAAEAARSSK